MLQPIEHCFYINLEERTDRRERVEAQMRFLGIPTERFPAIRTENGRIGCSTSHLGALRLAKERDYDHVLIVEDDILFLKPQFFVSRLNAYLERHANDFDVLLLCGNNFPPFSPIDDTCIKVNRCRAATGYLVKKHYYDTLIANFEEGLRGLIAKPHLPHLYCIDMHWSALQQRDKWHLLIPLSVIQRPGYSDIERENVDYTLTMLDASKAKVMERTQKRQLHYFP